MKKFFFCCFLVASPLIWDAYSFTVLKTPQPASRPVLAIRVRREPASSSQAQAGEALKPGQTVYLNAAAEQ